MLPGSRRPLAQQLGRTPTDSDLARHLGVSGDQLRQARQAQLALDPGSLDAPLAGQSAMLTLADLLGQEDPRLEHMLSMRAVATHWGELPAPLATSAHGFSARNLLPAPPCHPIGRHDSDAPGRES